VSDATGTPARLALDVSVVDDEGAGFALTADGELPPGTAPWRLLSVDVTRSGAFQGVAVTVFEAVLLAVEGTGEVRLDVEPEPSVLLQGFGAEAVSGAVIWSGAGLAPAPTPAVISQALATERGTEVGDPLDVRFDGTGRTAALRVAAIVPAIAGASSRFAVLVGLDTLSQNFLDATPQPGPAPSLVPPDQIWAAGDPSAAAALGDALGTSVQTPTDGAAAITSSLIPAWWASAVGGAVLAGVALIALLAALAAQRAGEVLVLRALGIPPARQAGLRVVEASVVAALAAALGLVGGLLLAALLVPVMADTAVPGSAVSGAGGLVVEPWVLAAALSVLALALAIAAVLAASAIARQGSSTRLEEAAA
ncbi:MAG TPA: FtsX-like permease family protein, partial [Microbacterium sp.]|nr:FtsX-like permease family protein [Microbacterium sp.]